MDARNKLSDAIKNKRTAPKPAAPPPPPPPPAPVRPASGVGSSPRPSGGAARSAKKSAKGASKKKAKKAKAKKAKPKKSKSKKNKEPGAFKLGMKRFGKNVVEEFKKATQEISPKNLAATAAEIGKGIGAAVGDKLGRGGNGEEDGYEADGVEEAPDRYEQDGAPAGAGAAAAGPTGGPPAAQGGGVAVAPGAAPGGAEAAPDFSPAKVQRAPKKRQAPQEEEAAEFSPAKVQRAPKKQSAGQEEPGGIDLETGGLPPEGGTQVEIPAEEVAQDGAGSDGAGPSAQEADPGEAPGEPAADGTQETATEGPPTDGGRSADAVQRRGSGTGGRRSPRSGRGSEEIEEACQAGEEAARQGLEDRACPERPAVAPDHPEQPGLGACRDRP